MESPYILHSRRNHLQYSTRNFHGIIDFLHPLDYLANTLDERQGRANPTQNRNGIHQIAGEALFCGFGIVDVRFRVENIQFLFSPERYSGRWFLQPDFGVETATLNAPRHCRLPLSHPYRYGIWVL